MEIKHTNFHAVQISLHDNNLSNDEYRINPIYYKKISHDEQDNYKIHLFIEIKNTSEHPFPVDLFLEFVSDFSFSNYDSKEEIRDFLNVSAVQMMFPYMRTAVSTLLSSALLPPIILPILDIRKIKTVK